MPNSPYHHPLQVRIAPVHRLPPELWGRIIHSSAHSEQLSLCRVNRALYLLAIRYIYRSVTLQSPGMIVRCCRTILHRGILAQCVQSLEICYWPVHVSSSQTFPSFFRLIAQTLQSLSHLSSLRIAAPQRYEDVLRGCHLVRLRRFKTCLTVSEPLVLFINRHPELEDLAFEVQLHHFYVRASLTSTQLQSLMFLNPLPHMQYYRGRSEFLPYLLRQRTPLRMVHIELSDEGLLTAEQMVSSLGLFAGTTLEVLGCYIGTSWCLDLLISISKMLPNIELLTYCNLSGSNIKEQAQVYDTLTDCMPRFNRLKTCFLLQPGPFNYGRIDQSVLNQEFRAIVSWGTQCRSLYSVKLPNGIQWTRDQFHSHLWIPDRESTSHIPQIIDWLVELLSSYPDSVTAWNALLNISTNGNQVPSGGMKHLSQTFMELSTSRRAEILASDEDEISDSDLDDLMISSDEG